MGSVLKRFLSYLLVFAMLSACIPGAVYADNNVKFAKDTVVSGLKPGKIINPLYAHIIDPSDVSAPKHTVSAASISTSDIRTTLAEAANELRQGMIERQAEIAITYPANAEFDADAIWQEALAHTGDPKAGDYLKWQWSALTWSPYLDTVSGVYYYTMVYYPEYFTTAQQEAKVDTAVDSLLKELNLWDKSDYQKIQGVYDWLCDNVVYDYDNLNDSAYLLKHSAYAALIDRKAVCQGYALLFYRLALELGVDARYISGTGNGGAHGWNIARIDGLYYNLDATWDASWHQSGAQYNWFLRGSGNFTDHIRDDEYLTPEFVQQYPTDPMDYGAEMSWPVSGKCGDDLTWQLSKEGVLTVSGSGNMYDYYSEYPGWYDYAWHIKSVVIEKDVTSIGANAFYYCAMLEDVKILGSADIHELAFVYCSALHTLSMENAVSVGDYAFLGCTSLSSVNIPASVSSIGVQVFNGCTALKQITVSAQNTKYCADGNVLFSKDKTQLLVAGADVGTAYTVPSSVTRIYEYAFANCKKLQQITIPDSVRSIAEGVFLDCTALTEVYLPDGLVSIGAQAFSGCQNLKTVDFPNGLEQICYASFEGCKSLKEVTFPKSLIVLGAYAFSKCAGIQTIRFSGEAPEIGEMAFDGVYAQAYYPDPAVFTSWTYDKMHDYGGFIQWISYSPHNYSAVVTPPTCTEQGYTTYTCSDCGDSYTGNYVPATGHTWDDGVVTVEPTEKSEGQRTYTCLTCGEKKTEVIPAVDHVHSYTSVVTPPTCTEKGYTTHTCTTCGDTYQDTFTEPINHSFGDWNEEKAPSCTKAGEKRRECANCGAYEVAEIPALGHNCKAVVTVPTCTQKGYTTHSCERCDYSYKDSFVDALGHKMEEWSQTKAPTCTEKGTERRDCSNCDHYETRDVAAKGHSFTKYVSDGNATCTADGTKTAKCDHGCGMTDTVADPGTKLEHTYGQWSQTKAPTCTEKGTERRDCSNCDHYETRDVAATGHSFGQWYVVKPATTKEEGLQRRDCKNCSHSEEKAIPVVTGPDKISSDVYSVGDGTVSKIPVGTTIADFLKNIHEAEYVGVYRDGKEVSGDALIGTGMEIRLTVDGNMIQTLTAVVTGDVNGDGTITITDMLAVKAHLLNKSMLRDVYCTAGDTNGDGAISITDFLQIKAKLLNKGEITPRSVNISPRLFAL